MKFIVNEIFTSIQGEGIHTGLLTTFIRFAGCNLRCLWCDTPYALELDSGSPTEIVSIIDEVDRRKAEYVCITGGEPLIQKDIGELLIRLAGSGRKVDVETNGSIDISTVLEPHPDITISMDVKLPSSKEGKSFDMNNLEHIRESDQLKFIVSDENDMDHALSFLRSHRPVSNIIFTPCSHGEGEFIARKLISSLDDDDLLDIMKRTRLMVQTHKVLWDPDRRGV